MGKEVSPMRKLLISCLLVGLVFFVGLLLPAMAAAPEEMNREPVNASGANSSEKPIRELYVPNEALHELLEGPVRRMYLSRKQYDQLLIDAKQDPAVKFPVDLVLLSAEYAGTVHDDRVHISGDLVFEVLKDELHAVRLPLGRVGILAATLDGKGAELYRSGQDTPSLLVSGAGRHKLHLELVTPLATSAAQQSLQFELPHAPAGGFKLSVPGNVEIKSGAKVASRVVDEAVGITRFELLPSRGETSLVMSLNNRRLQKESVVISTSILVDEVTSSYERFHATVTLHVLHGAVDTFRFNIPNGFDISRVMSPLLSTWGVAKVGDDNVLTVRLREPVSDSAVLNFLALKTSSDLSEWTFPQFVPLDVAGQTSVVGVLADEVLRTDEIRKEGLIEIDAADLVANLPETVDQAQPGDPKIRPVTAFYAASGEYDLQAKFSRPKGRFDVTSIATWMISDAKQQLVGSFKLTPRVDKLFACEFSVPTGWHVERVTDVEDAPIPFELFESADGGRRVRVRFPEAIPAGEEDRGGKRKRISRSIYFDASATPTGWLTDWQTRKAKLPRFIMSNAARDEGAIVIQVLDDFRVRPVETQDLVSLGKADKARFQLESVDAALAYQYRTPKYQAEVELERITPRVTATGYSILSVQPEGLNGRYVVVYQVDDARTERLRFRLPKTTPAALSIKAMKINLDDPAIGKVEFQLKETSSEVKGENREWTALLPEGMRGKIFLEVEFHQQLADDEPKDHSLPIVKALGVDYQTGMIAVEGHTRLDVQVATKLRRIDVGNMVDAEYKGRKRLLGAYAYVGENSDVKVSVFRHPGYGLPPTIVQRAELITQVAQGGVSQSVARFSLKTKALFAEIRLPENSSLWSALLNGKPIKPQREGERILLSLPAGMSGIVDLQIAFQTKIGSLKLLGNLDLAAPKLFLRAAEDDEPKQVPVADLVWHLYLPQGYQVGRSHGSVFTEDVAERSSPVQTVAMVALATPLALPMASQEDGAGYAQGGVDLAYETNDLEMPALDALASNDLQHTLEEAKEDYTTSSAVGGDADGDDEAAPGDVPPATEAPPEESKPSDANDAPDPPNAPTEPLTPAERRRLAAAKRGLRNSPWQTIDTGDKEDSKLPSITASTSKVVKLPGKKQHWGLAGVRSLQIDLQTDGESVTFRSLGVEPRLQATIVHQSSRTALAGAVSAILLLIGLAFLKTTVRRRVTYLVGLFLVSTLLPILLPQTEVFGNAWDAAFFTACGLTVFYVFVYALQSTWQKVWTRFRPATTAALLGLVGGLSVLNFGACVWAQQPMPVVVVDAPRKPLKVPADAIIVPYDASVADGVEKAEKVLIPYDQYVELWNRAHPDQKLARTSSPVPYSLAGGHYTTTLVDGDSLLVTGEMSVTSYRDEVVEVPFTLVGGVLESANLNDLPARLKVVHAAPDTTNKMKQQARVAPSPALLVLVVKGKGTHQLKLRVRMKLERRGGWRVVQGQLPIAPATSLAFNIPAAKTAVRLSGVADRTQYETTAANEKIETALLAGENFSVLWRPQIAQVELDRSLTAKSNVLFDIREDGLRLVWDLALEFPQAKRDTFRLSLPADYLVERVSGANVRGWAKAAAVDGRPQIDVTLLKEVSDRERLTLTLARRGQVGVADMNEVAVPAVTIPDAALHHGQLTIRRSDEIDLQAQGMAGMSRIDIPSVAAQLAKLDEEQASPLGVKAFQAYRFVRAPFAMTVAVKKTPSVARAEVHTLVRVSTTDRSMESRITYRVDGRPRFRASIVVPADLEIENVRVNASGEIQWSVESIDDRRTLTVFLAQGQSEQFSVVIDGRFPTPGELVPMTLPQLEVLDVSQQEGDLVVQLDPALDVRAGKLQNCDNVLLNRVKSWLAGQQFQLARLALHYRQAPYQGELTFTRRDPLVNATSITDIRVTDEEIEENVFLDFNVKQAGLQRFSFVLPATWANAQVHVPLLRETKVTPLANDPLSVRFSVELQEAVMGQIRVLIQRDRLFSNKVETAVIPILETGRIEHRYVVLVNASSDELVVESHKGLQALGREQSQWQTLAALLEGKLTQSYSVDGDAQKPKLDYRLKSRKAVETAGARIGLAEATLVLDGNGTYRARQRYQIENRTEQFLVLQLPTKARLWTVVVAGTPVKPLVMPGAKTKGQVRIPLAKTARGDRDYLVEIKYGGRLTTPASMSSISFPLVRTVNIEPELSQVRLHLPEDFRWFDFRGTMKREVVKGDLKASYFNSYLNPQLDRLNEIMSSSRSSTYEKERAKESFYEIKKEVDIMQQEAGEGEYALNTGLQKAAAANVIAFSELERHVNTDGVENADVVDAVGNRYRLQELVDGQRNDRATNQVDQLDGNFEVVPDVSGNNEGKSQGRFKAEWFGANKLQNKGDGKYSGRVVTKGRSSESQGEGQGEGQEQGQSFAPNFNRRQSAQLEEQQKITALQNSSHRLNQEGDRGQRYGKLLQEKRRGVVAQGGNGRDGSRTRFGDENGQARWEEAGKDNEFSTVVMGGEIVSLDVELPERGQVFNFTTPRGEVEITARAISDSLVSRLLRFAWVLGGLGIIGVVTQLVRRGGLNFLRTKLGAVLLIPFGLVLFCFFPVLGTVAVVAGVLLTISALMIRREA